MTQLIDKQKRPDLLTEKQRYTGLGLLAIAMWGGLAALSQWTLAWPPFLLLSVCFAISFGLMLVKRKFQNEVLLTLPNMPLSTWVAGLIGLLGFHLCYFIAMKGLPVLQTSLVVYLWPLILACLVAKPGTRKRTLIFGVIGFLSVAQLLILQTNDELSISWSSSRVIALGFAMSCAMIWSLYSWYLARVETQVDDIGWLSLAVSVICFAIHLLFEKTYVPSNQGEIFAAILLGLGPIGGAFYLWDLGLKKGNTGLIASSSFLSPVLSTLTLVLLGFSDFNPLVLLALVGVLLAAWLGQRPATKVK